MLTRTDIQSVSPALDRYTQGSLLGDLWKRPGLSPLDRSIVTLTALIARNQTIEMPYYFDLAIDNGVKPSEISEVITHLAFYSGWPNAMSAVPIVKDIFAQRGIRAEQLPAVAPKLSFRPCRSSRAFSTAGPTGRVFQSMDARHIYSLFASPMR
jgi:4-carboxymuconolactone decarboxylase